MRLWSLHPSLLDRQGLVAGWREALLAQAVLLGQTRGYKAHPQLERFRSHPEPEAAIGAYLVGLHEESRARGYRFDAGKINQSSGLHADAFAHIGRIEVTFGQLGFELSHLRAKLFHRSPDFLAAHAKALETTEELVPAHPLFKPVAGPIATWERTLTS